MKIVNFEIVATSTINSNTIYLLSIMLKLKPYCEHTCIIYLSNEKAQNDYQNTLGFLFSSSNFYLKNKTETKNSNNMHELPIH